MTPSVFSWLFAKWLYIAMLRNRFSKNYAIMVFS